MKYSDKVKASKEIVEAIYGLTDGNDINVLYKGDTYKISAYKSIDNSMSYSVWSGYSGMNVSKVGRTSLTLYSYDMMSQRTTYRLNLLECSIVDKN